jgi:hypothetical protein
LYDFTADTIILHTQCNMRWKMLGKEVRKGEPREQNYCSAPKHATQSETERVEN